MNNHILYQQDDDSNNGDVSSGYGFETVTLSPNEKVQVPLRI